MDERSQFTFYLSFGKAAERIRKKSDRCDFYDIVKDYALYGTEPNLDACADAVAIAFDLIKPTLDASRRKASNGKVGGRSKQTPSKPEAKRKQTGSKRQANSKRGETQSEKEGEDENENEKEKEKEVEVESECYPPTPLPGAHTPTRFTPPTVAEVEAYCRERGNRVDANRFVDFYTGKGWMIGKSPMIDWKAAVRTWENGDNKPQAGKATKAQELDEFYSMVGNWAAEREA